MPNAFHRLVPHLYSRAVYVGEGWRTTRLQQWSEVKFWFNHVWDFRLFITLSFRVFSFPFFHWQEQPTKEVHDLSKSLFLLIILAIKLGFFRQRFCWRFSGRCKQNSLTCLQSQVWPQHSPFTGFHSWTSTPFTFLSSIPPAGSACQINLSR